MAIDEALKDIGSGKSTVVPENVKNAVYAGEKKMGKGAGYKYAHSYEGGYVEQDYMHGKKKYYNPTEHGFEKKIKARMEERGDGKKAQNQ